MVKFCFNLGFNLFTRDLNHCLCSIIMHFYVVEKVDVGIGILYSTSQQICLSFLTYKLPLIFLLSITFFENVECNKSEVHTLYNFAAIGVSVA